MVANKSAPNHWIRTEWIDPGHVHLFESNADDNPHVSEDAKRWWDILLTGSFRDRMIGNEWAGDYAMIGTMGTWKGEIGRGAERNVALWIDDARGHWAIDAWFMPVSKILIVSCVEHFGRNLREAMNWCLWKPAGRVERRIANLPVGFGRLTDYVDDTKGAGAFVMIPQTGESSSEYAAEAMRHVDRLFAIEREDCQSTAREFSKWMWRNKGVEEIGYRPESTRGDVLATSFLAWYLWRSGQPIAKGGTI